MTRPLSLFGAAVLADRDHARLDSLRGRRSGGTRLVEGSRPGGDVSDADARRGADRGGRAATRRARRSSRPAIVADFESVGWTVRAEPFRAGEMEIPEGVQCVWGDFSTATDHVQIFGWAPISEDDAAEVEDHLVEVGWRVEESSEGTIVTESAETTIATDEEGYGLTYLFGDGWVKYADTKQGLILVVWPSG